MRDEGEWSSRRREQGEAELQRGCWLICSEVLFPSKREAGTISYSDWALLSSSRKTEAASVEGGSREGEGGCAAHRIC